MESSQYPEESSNLEEGVSGSELDIEDYMKNLVEEALKYFNNDDMVGALTKLKQSEEIMEIMATKGKPAKMDYVLVTLHNIACCYQKLGDVENCAAYLEACSFNCSKSEKLFKSANNVAKCLKIAKLHTRVLIQHCVSLSNLKKHKEALEKAKESSEKSILALKLTVQTLEIVSSRLKSRKVASKLGEKQMFLYQNIVSSANETLKVINQYIEKGFLSNENQTQMRSVLGVKTFGNWVYDFKITDIMVLQPLSIEEFQEKRQLHAEITKDFLLYKIALHSVSLFCTATEMKHLRSTVDKKKEA